MLEPVQCLTGRRAEGETMAQWFYIILLCALHSSVGMNIDPVSLGGLQDNGSILSTNVTARRWGAILEVVGHGIGGVLGWFLGPLANNVGTLLGGVSTSLLTPNRPVGIYEPPGNIDGSVPVLVGGSVIAPFDHQQELNKEEEGIICPDQERSTKGLKMSLETLELHGSEVTTKKTQAPLEEFTDHPSQLESVAR
ncbi:uncharacterized protein [Periplaneta americana]|uniref:uncharacterized protein n=1 Tax=Periplaneta americana TaxID=6978 RepID=UPI0037E937BF